MHLSSFDKLEFLHTINARARGNTALHMNSILDFRHAQSGGKLVTPIIGKINYSE